jgi:hypothetical protein
VVDLFLDRAAADPAHPAIEQNGTSVTYGASLNLEAPVAKLQRSARLLEPDIILGRGELAAALGQAGPKAIVLNPTPHRPILWSAAAGIISFM